MPIRFNKQLLLWALGVLQPSSAEEIRIFLREIYKDISDIPSAQTLDSNIRQWVNEGLAARVYKKDCSYYSLTYRGNSRFPIRLRRNRDKVRLFLLKDARSGRMYLSGEQIEGLAGVSPAADGSSTTQDMRPKSPPFARSAPKGRARSGRPYWPQLSRQLLYLAGPKKSSPDIFFDFYSFPSLESLRAASVSLGDVNDTSVYDLALAIGISPRLVTSFLHATWNHYRSFVIGKRGGGTRTINAPRLFLKVVQYWILDYELFSLKIHPSCHSYQLGKSIITNASHHSGKQFVANLDINDFFGSINTKQVTQMLVRNGFGENMSKLFAQLVTLNDALPQGAPTSPVLSNSFLYEFDTEASSMAEENGLLYTRYADDITLSGEKKEVIVRIINKIVKKLKKYELSINEKKTRIASNGGQQRVTGLVVNVKAAPPRVYRRTVRAMFHNASKHPADYKQRVNELRGHLSYLTSFYHLAQRNDVEKYRAVFERLRKR